MNPDFLNLTEAETRELLARFECRRCQRCCRQPGFVYITPEESESIAALVGMETFEFVNAYCELRDKRRLVLKKHADESCIFLTETECSIHAAKPAQCRDFPVKWRTPRSFEYCEGLKEIFENKGG